MQITSVEEAQVVLGVAINVLDRYESIMNEFISRRADFELAMSSAPADFRASQASDALTGMRKTVQAFLKQALQHTDMTTIEELRDRILRAKIQLGIVGDFQDRVISQEFYLDIYEQSNTSPTNMGEGKTFDLAEERRKLAEIKTQLAKAEELFKTVASTLYIGEPSTIMLPRIAALS